jgi:shikimate dehydrogenase
LVLIGSDASKAMSPPLWNSAFKHLGNGWTYEAWDVPANNDMTAIRKALLAPDIVAANVTMPHKQWAATTAESTSRMVRLSGAANTLVSYEGGLAAHNTDIIAVATLLGNRQHRSTLLLGAGGAARAALVALDGRTGRVTITDRDLAAAKKLVILADGMGLTAEAVPWSEGQSRAADASLVVNATSIGKDIDDAPAWGDVRLSPDGFVYDFVYAGHETASIISAREQGLECADGWDHLQLQAEAMIPLLGLALKTRKILHKSMSTIKTRI